MSTSLSSRGYERTTLPKEPMRDQSLVSCEGPVPCIEKILIDFYSSESGMRSRSRSRSRSRRNGLLGTGVGAGAGKKGLRLRKGIQLWKNNGMLTAK